MQSQVKAGVICTSESLTAVLDEVRGAVMIAYPMGLPAWDPVRQLLEVGDASPVCLCVDFHVVPCAEVLYTPARSHLCKSKGMRALEAPYYFPRSFRAEHTPCTWM